MTFETDRAEFQYHVVIDLYAHSTEMVDKLRLFSRIK